MSSPQVKKRGRRPKSHLYQGTLASDEPIMEEPNTSDESINADPLIADPTARVSTKRGRKAKVYNTVGNGTVQPPALGSTSDDENIILKLNIKESMLDEEADGLRAYNASSTNSFVSKPFELLHPCPSGSVIDDLDSGVAAGDDIADSIEQVAPAKTTALKVIHLLRDFEHKNRNNEWPSTTSIHCYWCCHKFDSPPFGVPIKYYQNKYFVTGCFCSLECASAYNFDSKDGLQQKFENYHLINSIARKVGYMNDVKRAPHRLSLKTFGGHLSIDQFRSFCKTSKLININFPPMMTLTQQLEELNHSDLDSDYKYVPIDTDRVNKYKEKIKLKRNRPLTNFKNTLDHSMNLKIEGSAIVAASE